jgi:CheY-like chemotaxis protein
VNPLHAPSPSHASPATRPCILLAQIEEAVAALVEEWLHADGYRVRRSGGEPGESPADLVLLELPFPRHGQTERLRRLAEAMPGVPVLALSPTFLPGIDTHGPVAQQLGVAAVLPAPLRRDALLAAVGRLLGPRP